MRLKILLASLLLPQLGWAQLFGGNSFESGSYVLASSRNVRLVGQLKLQSGSKLVMKTTEGKTLKLKPEDISSFRIGSQQYVVASNFHVKAGLGGSEVDDAFVEQLDSGQVVLLRYDYSVGGAPMMGAGGTMSYGGSYSNSAYLLLRRYDASPTVVQGGAYSSGGKRLREAVRPYLASRPDLVKMLDDKQITTDNLREVIHALNNNLAFTLSAAPTPD